MSYVPQAYDATAPLDSENAKTAAAEFRELKRYVTKIPVIEVSANKTFALADAGTLQLHPSADSSARAWEIPANAAVAFPVGTAISLAVDNAAGTITLTIAGGDTLRLLPSGLTGARTFPANSQGTLLKITSTTWQLTGIGIG